MTRDDADYIRSQLTARLEDVLASYFPGHVILRGRAYLSPKGPKALGSWSVNMTGGKRGAWYRFSQGVGGGVIELLSYHLYGRTDAYAEAFREARAFLGISGGVDEKANQRARQRQEEARRQAEVEEAQEREDSIDNARRILAECRKIKDGPCTAIEYLHGRGLETPPHGWSGALHFHPGLIYWQDGLRKKYPCLVSRVQDFAGETVAIQKIYLDPATAKKVPMRPAKVTTGPCGGGAVRLGGVASHINVCEGVETGIAIGWLTGFESPVWCTLGTSGMALLEVPLQVNKVTIWPDGDKPYQKRGNEFVPAEPAGRTAARKLAVELGKIEVECVIASEPPIGTDFADIWQNCMGEAA